MLVDLFLLKFLMDDKADQLIRSVYKDVPDLISTWSELTKPVLRADLFRYAVLYAYGGMCA